MRLNTCYLICHLPRCAIAARLDADVLYENSMWALDMQCGKQSVLGDASPASETRPSSHRRCLYSQSYMQMGWKVLVLALDMQSSKQENTRGPSFQNMPHQLQ